MPLSYSSLSTYESCPYKYKKLYIDKDVKSKSIPEAEIGLTIHKIFEKYLKNEDSLPIEYIKYQKLLDNIKDGEQWDLYSEYPLAIDINMKPIEYNKGNHWFRGIIDVLKIKDNMAYILDFKTGKKWDDPSQLYLSSLYVFSHFPNVVKIKLIYLWVKTDEHSTWEVYRDRDIHNIYQIFMDRSNHITYSINNNEFKCIKTKLCDYCPVLDNHICPLFNAENIIQEVI